MTTTPPIPCVSTTDYIAFRRLETTVRRLAFERGFDGVPLAKVALLGTDRQELAAVDLELDLPHDLGRHPAARDFCRAAILSSSELSQQTESSPTRRHSVTTDAHPAVERAAKHAVAHRRMTKRRARR